LFFLSTAASKIPDRISGCSFAQEVTFSGPAELGVSAYGLVVKVIFARFFLDVGGRRFASVFYINPFILVPAPEIVFICPI